MSDIKLAPEILAEAARLSDAAVRDMEAALPELPYGIDSVINKAIERMERDVKGDPAAIAISMPLYRQFMRFGALLAIDAITTETEKEDCFLPELTDKLKGNKE